MFWWWWVVVVVLMLLSVLVVVVVVTVVDYLLGNLVACTSVQFKIAAIHLRKPLCTAPVSQMFSPHSLRKQFHFSWTDDGPLSPFQARSASASSLRLSPCSLCCDVLGFVPAGNVSISSTLQTSREASHLRWLLCSPVYLLSHFLRTCKLGAPQGN